ncbi:MAG TPA: AmmeMemoRadiSam system protein B [Candidatus Udaeobacter sp.]|jgi:AmmeMemoRadiSam system protein B|nr:AmmeMemoRadiSam system protein B [Candidatus Udaeobacter sp.]
MVEGPSDPPRRPRLIVPGAEPEPAEKPRLVVPPGATTEEPAEKPRIVLPPGAAREEPADLPEFPRLRPLMLMPFRDGDRELILVSDPLGVIPGQPVLGIEALAILQLLDGTVSLNDLSAALMRESKDLRITQMVRDFVAQLDELLMLDSPRFDAAYRALREAYHALEIRPAVLEGRVYPAEREELARSLDQYFAAAMTRRDAAGEPAAAPDARPRAILAPHLDPRRSGETIARALLELGEQPPRPLRIVIFGTGHELFGDLFALTRKHFQTPLGKAVCDTAFVDAVASRLGEAAFHGELAHRAEHSIEFATIFLQHRLKDRPFTIVPILCGGFLHLLDEGRKPREDAGFEMLIQAVRETVVAQGGDTVYLASVDLSHVGPRFGDPPTDERVRLEVEAKDRAALEAAIRGNADAWFDAIASHDDGTRICGFAPTYALLRCAEPGAGRLLRYEQSIEDDQSLVSIASAVWP